LYNWYFNLLYDLQNLKLPNPQGNCGRRTRQLTGHTPDCKMCTTNNTTTLDKLPSLSMHAINIKHSVFLVERLSVISNYIQVNNKRDDIHGEERDTLADKRTCTAI